MIVLYKFPRALHCKTLVELPFSETPRADWECESLLLDLFCFHVLPSFFFTYTYLFFRYQEEI